LHYIADFCHNIVNRSEAHMFRKNRHASREGRTRSTALLAGWY